MGLGETILGYNFVFYFGYLFVGMQFEITKVTRQNILEDILKKDIYGKKVKEGDISFDFLNLIWDLENMPSTDSRFENASSDIWQHMINNSDWDEEFLYSTRLDLINAPQAQFIKFIETIVHPEVRTDTEEVNFFVEKIN